MKANDRGGTLPDSTDGRADLPQSETTLPARSQGRYVFIAEHARGGLGRVWRVFDRELGRELALKESLSNDALARQRFTHEAFTTARLEHPSIVPVHDAGASAETGALFYTMKLVSGATLAEVVKRAADLAGRLALLPRVLAVAEAVGYAHSRGVLHRDLKPENVLVGTFGETVVIDWGLAKALPEPAPSGGNGSQPDDAVPAELTRAGAVMGTPGYMSPEQAAGQPVDPRTDVFALGACLAFVVSGKTPGALATPQVGLAREEAGATTALRGVPRDLAAIINKAMAPQPDARYPDGKALADDLNRYLTRQPVAAHRYSVGERVGRWVQRHRAAALSFGVVVLLAGVGAAFAGVRESVLRRAADAERVRAVASARSLMEVQGRSELSAGHPRRAAVYLAEALRLAPEDPALRMLLGQAVRPLASRRVALEGMARDVVTVAWSPDGTLIATGGDDELVRVWRADTGALVKAVTAHARGLDAVAFSADGTRLASAGGDRRVRVVRLDTLEETHAFEDPNPYRVIFSPDGSKLVVGDQSGEVRVLDAQTGARLHTLTQHTNRAQELAFAPTGELVVVSWDRTASVWDGQTFALERVLDGFESEGAALAFSHDGAWAAVAESDASIHLYRLPAWTHSHRIRTPDDARFPAISFSADDLQLFARSAEGVVRAWHVSSGALLATIDVQPEGKLFTSAMRPDGKELVTGGLSGAAVIWSLEGVLDYRVLPVDDPARPSLLPGVVGPGGRLALPDTDGWLTLWAADGTKERRFEVGVWPNAMASSEPAQTVLVAHERSGHSNLKLRRLTGEEVAVVPHPKMVMNVAVSHDGERYATACYDGAVRVIDARTGAIVLTVPVSKERLSAVAFSPDGGELAVADGEGKVFFVDARSGAPRRSFVAHPTWVQDVEYSPDGKSLVTAGRQDHRVRVWELPSLTQRFDFGEHTDNVTRAGFSPDGTRIASVSVDHTALLYDARTGQLLRSWRGPSYTAEFLPGGRELLTSGYDGYAVVWNVEADSRSPQQLLDLVAQQAPWRLRDGRLVLER